MEITSAFKSEVLRPITTILVPGSIAAGPYFIVGNYYIPKIFMFWAEHPNAFVGIVTITIIASGLVLNNLGAAIEYYIIDKCFLEKANPDHFKEWYAYLKLKIGDEYVGQRYLRNALDRMRFELAMAPALAIFGIGVIWIQAKYHIWSNSGSWLFSLFDLVLVFYFGFEGYQSSVILAKVRKLLLDAEGATV